MNKANYLKQIDEVIERGPYKDNWDSLEEYQVPEWFKKLKFGIFIHWGIYSVPAFGNEWYSRNMYIQGSREYEHHREVYGPQSKFGYKDFIPMFKAEKFDANEWAELFKKAGAKYVIPVAEHHDGFQMYRSEVSHWNAYEMGPHKDVLGELTEAFHMQGIVNGASSHRVEHWFFMGHGKEFDSDIKEPLEEGDFYWPAMPEPKDHFDLFSEPAPTKEYLEDWLVRSCELVDRFQPKIFYFDWWIQVAAVKPYLKKFAAYYYNRGLEWGSPVVICYKQDAFQFGSALVDIERGQFDSIQPFYWQTDTAVAKNSWCYTTENEYKEAKDLICDLVNIVSKNGSMLLNIGPKPDGTIPEEDRHILEEIGEWMSINGEAIYGTKTWRQASEGPTKTAQGQFADANAVTYTREDFCFTVKGSYLYAIAMNYPEDGHICIRSLGEQDASKLPKFHGIIRDVEVLGSDEKPVWSRDTEGLTVQTHTVASDKPVVIKIKVD